MIKNKEIVLEDNSGRRFNAVLNMRVEQGKSLLTLSDNKSITITASGNNFFECFLTIRLELEKVNWIALCQGSMTNVYPSRMALQMSNGLKAYKLTLGKQASLDDLVDIFEPADRNKITTVNDQKSYFNAWIKSLTT